MNEPQDPNCTAADIPSVPADSLDAGLGAGFGKPVDGASSVLAKLRPNLGDLRPVQLREAEGESAHVVKPKSDAMPAPAETGDRYQLAGEIARGGMGAVLRGRDVDLGRDLAIKVLLEKYVDRPEVARRFLEEAQIGGQLQHPGVVPVYDIGRFGDRPFFTMKLVKGQTLAALLSERTDPAADRPRLLGIALQVAQTLAYAHAKGVIHRDLKPANVMVGAFGEVQVMDWGLAKVLAEGGIADEERASREHNERADVTTIRTARSTGSTGGSGQDTEAGSVLGTPAYMPPEQANGEVALLDRRADVFGLGAILCEILTGKPPYVGRSAEEVRRKAANGDQADARSRLAGCGADAELAALTAACLSPEPRDRPKDARAVADGLTAYLDGVQERLRRAELDRAAAVVQAREERKRRKLALALAASVLALALVGGAGAWGVAHWQSETNGRIQVALQEAGALRAQAQATPAGEPALARWVESEAAARRLDDLVAQGFPSAELRRRVSDFNAALAGEADAARRQADAAKADRLFLSQLADVRTSKEDEFDKADTDAAYRAAFAAYGLDMDVVTTDAAAARLLSRPPEVQVEAAAALDDWASERRRLRMPAADGERLLALARAVDRDPQRTALRSLDYTSIANDRQKLVNLADTAKVAELPPATAELLARTLRAAGETDRAEAVLREAQRLHPGDVWLNYELADLLEERPALYGEEVIRFYTATRAVRPEIGHALAHALAKQGRKDETLALFAELTRLRPDNPRHHNCLGVALNDKDLKDKKQPEAAIKEFHTAIALDPKFAAPHTGLGNVLLDKKELEAAIQEFRAAIDLDPKDASAHNGLGRALVDKKELNAAILEFRAAIALDPKNAVPHNNLGFALVDKKELDAAILEFRAAIALDPKDAYPHNGLGNALRIKKELDEAIKEYRAAIALDPQYAPPQNGLGNAHCDKKELDEAIKVYRAVIALDPSLGAPHNGLGNVFFVKEELDEAIKEYRAAIALDPKVAPPHDGLGNALRIKEELDEAIKEYRAAIALDPKLAWPHNGLGNALRDKKELDEAIKEYRAAIDLDPKDAMPHNGLGNVLVAKKELDAAILEYRAAIDLDPKAASHHYGLGRALRDKKELDAAILEFRAAVALDPKNASAHFFLATALHGKKQLDQAIEELQKAIEFDGKFADAEGYLALVLLEQGRFAQAGEANRRFLKLLPEGHPLRNTATQQLRKCEQLLALDEKLPAILEGKQKAADGDRVNLAWLCQQPYKRLYAASAGLYAEALAARPERAKNPANNIRYNAARSAALAGCGAAKDADKPDDKERARLRQQALDWLRADLAAWTKLAESDKPKDREAVQETLKHWQEDDDLAAVRGKDALEKLPEAERDAWRKLWDDVAAVLK